MSQEKLRDFTEQELASLPSQQRAVLAAHLVDKLTYEQVADTLHIPIGTVRSRINRARAKILKLRAEAQQQAA